MLEHVTTDFLFFWLQIPVIFSILFCTNGLVGQVHPSESLGRIFFDSLKTILPCEICRGHYKEFLKKKPISPYLDNKKSLMEWVLDCHNNINKIISRIKINSSNKFLSLSEKSSFDFRIKYRISAT